MGRSIPYMIKSCDYSMSFTEKIFLICIVFSAGSQLDYSFSIVSFVMLALFIVLMITKKIVITRTSLFFVMGLAIASLIWVLQTSKYSNSGSIVPIIKYFFIISMPVIYITSPYVDKKESMKFVVKTIIGFSILSNIIYVGILLGVLPITQIKPYCDTFLYLELVFRDPVYGIVGGLRNSGIYWEPGMYQVYLNFALLFVLYAVNEMPVGKKIALIIYLAATIMTTGSITGILLCAILIAVYVILGSKRFVVKLFGGVILLAVAIYSSTLVFGLIQSKLTLGTSFTYRLRDIFFGLEVFNTNPIIGHGISNDVYENMSKIYYGAGREVSNGLMVVLIDFGIIGALLYIIGIFNFFGFLKHNLNKRCAIAFLIWFVISINTEPITLNSFCFFILGIGLYELRYSKYLLTDIQQ